MFNIDLEEQKEYIAFVESALDDWFKEICSSDAGFLKRVLDNIDNAMINDFIQKSKEYYNENDILKNHFIKTEPEDYETIYTTELITSFKNIEIEPTDYNDCKSKTLNEVFSRLENRYHIMSYQHIVYQDRTINDNISIGLTTIFLHNYQHNANIIEKELNDAGYVLVKNVIYDTIGEYNIIGLLFAPIEYSTIQIDDFVNKCYEYCTGNEEFITRFKEEPIEDYMVNYSIRQGVPKIVSDYNNYYTKTVNDAINGLEYYYGTNPMLIFSYVDDELVNGKLTVQKPVRMIAVMANREDNIRFIEQEVNDAGYCRVHHEKEENFNKFGIYPAFFIPIEKEPIDNYLYNRKGEDRYKYLYYVEPKDKHVITYEYGVEFHTDDNYFYENNREYFIYDSKKYIEYFQKFRDIMNKNGKSNICDLYLVEVTPELLNSVTFYRHPKNDDCCVRDRGCCIKDEFITKVEDIDLSKF